MTLPGPGLIRSLARVPQFRRDPLSGFRQGWRTYGDLYRVQIGRRDLWVCSHPELIHQVLVTGRDDWLRMDAAVPDERIGLALALGDGLITTDGAEWQWRRRIVNPAFHRRRVEQMATTMVDAGNRMLERRADRSPDSESAGEPATE
ncbi:MAG: cytochrome P450 [Acidimicrobiia bacterium]